MDVVTWVQESHGLAQAAYKALPKLNAQKDLILDSNNEYFSAGLKVVNDHLAKTGLRLGKVLEKALG